jgi:cellulose synthase/poly-beta-1,6-N-acetylglucosamine synthase-like glycosyltransferase
MGLGIEQRGAEGRPVTTARTHRDAPRLVLETRHDRHPCPELDCLRGWLRKGTIAAAARRAAEVGTGADRVLIGGGLLDEDIYLRLLSDSLGVGFESLENTKRGTCPLDDERLIEAPAAGLLPLTIDGEVKLVVAPRDYSARRLTVVIRSRPELAKAFRLTTAARLQAFVSRHGEAVIGERATRHLAEAHPVLSAAPPRRWPSFVSLSVIVAASLFALFAAPAIVKLACDIFLTLLFLAWTVLRMVGVLLGPVPPPRRARLADQELPIYTIMAPLYREARSVPGLVSALRGLDYPPEKLDIKLIVEADDRETRDALSQLGLEPPFQVVVSPDIGPRTKPKALNVALPFARGAFTVIYDAEDRPERGQLRRALDTFLVHDESLACVQASLTIDNAADNWLTAMFTAEYAGQFDVFLPALTRLGMPLPLGGSSNHFRTGTLRAVGAWDPYNVTEDADLGVRLSRFGYRSVAISSPTYEEAPARFGLWLRQRTRWMKGWMQTWIVHMRAPFRLRRDLGVWSFLAVQLIVGGNVLASLVHPLMIGWLIAAFIAETPLWTTQAAAAVFAAAVIGGYATSVVIGTAGLFRRGLSTHAWVLLLVPVHWLLLSLAAWRALYQLIRDPYLWEKTEHGLARTSRAKPLGNAGLP